MTHLEIVKKLVGPINPVGESNTDEQRFDNLKTMCELVDSLLTEIHAVNFDNRHSQEFSVKRSADYAKDFIYKMGINE